MYVVDNRAGATYSAAALNRVFVGNIPRVLSLQLRGAITQSCLPGDVVSISGGSAAAC